MPGESGMGDNRVSAGGEAEGTGQQKDKLPETAAAPGKSRKDEILSTVTPEEDVMNIRETLRDMVAGIVFFSLIFAAVGGIIVYSGWLRWSLGVFFGGGTACLMLWHMYVTIDRALDMDAEAAARYGKKSAVRRMLLAAAALAIAGLCPGIFHVIGVFMGIFSLKFAAYLQPLTHKLIKIFSKGGWESGQ